MKDQRLHIITPSSSLDPESLLSRQPVAPGDLVADLSQTLITVYSVGDDQLLQDISAQILGESDPRAVAREWLLNFTERTGLQDELAIDGHGYWWSLNSLQFNPGLSELGKMFAWIDALVALCEQKQPASLIIYGNQAALAQIVEQVFEGTECKVQSEALDRKTPTSRPPRHAGLLAARFLLGFAYLVYSLVRHPEICVLANTNLLRQQVLGSRHRLWDIFVGDVVQAFRSRGWRTTIVERYGWNASWQGLVARGFFLPGEVVEFLGSPLVFKLGLHRRTVQKWQQRWEDLQPKLTNHLQHRGVDLTALVLPLLALQFKQRAPSHEVTIGIWRRLFRIWKPRLVFVNNSYAITSMTAIVAAKQLDIETGELQHGVIGRNHTAYLVPERLTATAQVAHCDTMMVWGEYTKRLLVDNGVYRPDQVLVTGSPRMDALLDNLAPRRRTLEQLDISTDLKVVLYASNMLADGFRDEILDSLQRDPDATLVHWIIKLHPREKTRSAWEAGIESRGIVNAMVLEGEADFYALLAACDYHVSYVSTTLIEAAVMGKPNLGLSSARSVDPTGFAEANAFLPVAPADLGPAIGRLMDSPHLFEQLLTEQKAFADDWCLHDGQAISRIVSFVETIPGMSRK